MRNWTLLFFFSVFCVQATAEIRVAMVKLSEKSSEPIGYVTITQSDYGVVFTPYLHGLPAGQHGFHVHQNPSCDSAKKHGKIVQGLKAGGHFDPKNHQQHGYPWQEKSHLGDLPSLWVNGDGQAITPVLAPKITTLAAIKDRALMIHLHGDNYADQPKKLGGGGARLACGVIE